MDLKIQQSLQSTLDLEAVKLYKKLIQPNYMLETSQFENLKKFVNDTVIFWFEMIKEEQKTHLTLYNVKFTRWLNKSMFHIRLQQRNR